MHTREESLAKFEHERRMRVLKFYAAKRTAKKVQKFIKENGDSLSGNRLGGCMLRAADAFRAAIPRDKEALGLRPWSGDMYMISRDQIGFIKTLGISFPIKTAIMSVEAAYDGALLKQKGVTPDEFVMPRFYDELVAKAGITLALGSAIISSRFFPRDAKKKRCLMRVYHARRIKEEWISEQNLAAYRVAVIPDLASEPFIVMGYVVKSSMSDAVFPAFAENINEAVSLCKRRIKQEVLKRMGV